LFQYSINESTMNLEPNDLLLFARIAETGSFSRAAQRVGLPKSTVSRRLAALESHLDGMTTIIWNTLYAGVR